MFYGLVVTLTVVLVPFVLAVARYLVLRARHPARLYRWLAARGPSGGLGAGATVLEEVHAFFNSNKRIEQEERRVRLVLREEESDGAPPRMGIDLEAGKAVVRPRDAGRDTG
jgi:hypothetical protein